MKMTQTSIMVLAAFLSACGPRANVMAPPGAGEFTFEQHELVIDSANRQTVLTGFLLGGAVAELAVVNIDENDNRRLRVYAFEGGAWESRLDAILRPEVLFVDVANVGGRDRLVTYEPGRLNWFDPGSATERVLVAVPSNHEGEAPRRLQVPHVDITRDVNGDALDDLVVPDSVGFWVFIQTAGGAFANPVKIGSATEMRRKAEMGLTPASDGYRYAPWSHSRIHEIDHDRDGRNDLVFWNVDHFEVHHQDESGLFAPQAKTFATDVAFDSDGLYSLGLDASGEEWTALHRLGDLNGDGVADLVTLSPEGASVRTTWSKAKSLVIMDSKYEARFGRPAPEGGIVFGPDIDTTIQSDGVQLEMQQHDFDRDGQMDVMFTTGKFAIHKLFRALLTGSVTLNLEFYRMQGGAYADKPNATRKIRAGCPPWPNRWFYPAVLIGDVNGDQRSDLLVQKSRKELSVFVGVPGPELFARQPQKVAVAMPKDEEYTWLADLNKDRKQDILMHHASTTEPHRVTMLIAQ